MNKGFIQTAPDTMIVTKENGGLEERKVENGNVEKKLILENNIEFINNIIITLECYVNSGKKLERDALLSSLEIPVSFTAAGAALGTLYNEPNLVGIGLGIGGICSILSLLCVGIPRLNNVKHKKEAYQMVLERAYLIREKLVKEMIGLRGSGNLDEVQLNVPVAISEDNDFIKQTTESLNETYISNVPTRSLKKAQDLPF